MATTGGWKKNFRGGDDDSGNGDFAPVSARRSRPAPNGRSSFGGSKRAASDNNANGSIAKKPKPAYYPALGKLRVDSNCRFMPLINLSLLVTKQFGSVASLNKPFRTPFKTPFKQPPQELVPVKRHTSPAAEAVDTKEGDHEMNDLQPHQRGPVDPSDAGPCESSVHRQFVDGKFDPVRSISHRFTGHFCRTRGFLFEKDCSMSS